MKEKFFNNSMNPEAGQAGYKHVQVFESIKDIMHLIENPADPPIDDGIGGQWGDYSRIDNANIKKSWAGVSSKEEAIELLKNGWPKGEELLKQRNMQFERLSQELEDIQIDYGITGAYVDIGAYVSGIPECMASPTIYFQETQGVRIVASLSAAWTIKERELIARGAAIANVAYALSIMNIPCEIWSCSPVEYRSTLSINFYKIKNSTDYLDIPKMMFMLAHPAMFRVIDFWIRDKSYAEFQRVSDITGGRGYPYKLKQSDLYESTNYKTLLADSITGADSGRVIDQISRVVTDLESIGIKVELLKD